MIEAHPARGEPAGARARRQQVRDNAFGLGGTDLNGRDLAYDGNGTGNCFAGNTGVSRDDPGRRLDARRLPVQRRRTRSAPPAQGELVALDRRGARGSWIKHPHAPRAGLEPLELYMP